MRRLTEILPDPDIILAALESETTKATTSIPSWVEKIDHAHYQRCVSRCRYSAG